MKIRILTVLWGPDFVGRLMHYTARSLVAPNNLPALAAHDVVYEIWAPAIDIERIRSHPVFPMLTAAVAVRFHPFRLQDIASNNAMEHWRLWRRAVEVEHVDDSCIMLVAPDQVLADGALKRWTELLEQGHHAVFTSGFQVSLETISGELEERFPSETPISLTLPELHRLALIHLHPVMISLVRGSPRHNPHPEWHLRATPAAGMVQRVLSSHAYAFRPSRIELSDNFCPVADLDKVAFEPSWFIGLEPLLKQLAYYLRPTRLDETTLSYFGVWAEHFMRPVHLIESQKGWTLPLDRPGAGAALQAQNRSADFFVSQMVAGRAIIRFLNALRAAGLPRAAQWVAAAHLHARLRRRLPLRGPLTVFAPDDVALAALVPQDAAGLLADDGRSLIAALRAHVSSGHHRLKPGDHLAADQNGAITALDGGLYSVADEGAAKVLAGPFKVDDALIYVIDRSVAPLRFDTLNASPALRSLRRRYGALRLTQQRGRAALIDWLQGQPRLYAAVRAVHERLVHGVKPPPLKVQANSHATQLYRQAIALRALAALRDFAGFHAHHVLGQPRTPLAAVLDGLRASGISTIADILAAAVKADPMHAEAWLELGHLRRETGDDSNAMDAFARAQALPSVLPAPAGKPETALLASIEHAKLLARADRNSEALAALDAVDAQRSAPWEYFLWRARMLAKLGRTDEALEAFTATLRWSGPESRQAADLPSDLDQLRRPGG